MARPRRISLDTWNNVDWKLPASEIAQIVGCHVNTVYWMAKELGITLVHAKTGNPPQVDWNKVDWSNPNNAEIARILGVSRQAVAQRRPKPTE